MTQTSTKLVLEAQKPQNIRLPVMKCDMQTYNISQKELKIAEHKKKKQSSIHTVSYSVCILVTIKSLQRAGAVQNNRLTACREERQRFIEIHCHAKYTADIHSSSNCSVLNPQELNSLYF